MRFFLVCSLLAFLSWVGLANIAFAAEFTKGAIPECAIQLRGEIVAGDFEKFLPVAQQLFPGSDGESTSRDTVCLDSPGGDLAEGVKFAQYFYDKGIGTVVDDGQSCVSACAVMFMMGIATGPEVNFINRKLHVGGELGFHRPYTTIDTDRLVAARALNFAYDAAFEAAMKLLIIANNKTPWSNSQMMKPDLIQAMLQHIGSDLFLIDTIDKVGRFDIELFGFDPPRLLNDEQAFYACENSFQWQYGLTKEDKRYPELKKKYDELNIPLSKSFSLKSGKIAYEVTSLDSGYSNASCVISRAENELQGCGLNEATSVTLGTGECGKENHTEKSSWLRIISVFDPSTPIATLHKSNSVPTPVLRSGLRCYVFDGVTKVDDEPCIIESHALTDATKKGTIFTFVWPTGSKTVIVRAGEKETINGAAAIVTSRVGFGPCLLNSETKKEFCISK